MVTRYESRSTERENRSLEGGKVALRIDFFETQEAIIVIKLIKVDAILEYSEQAESKYFALQILEDTIQTK